MIEEVKCECGRSYLPSQGCLCHFPEIKIQDFLKEWLRGTTCHHESKRDCVWQSEDKRFVIFRHGSHSSYCGRAYGSQNCESYQHLYDMEHLNRDSWYNFHPLKEWKGRWNQSKIEYAEDLIEAYLEESE